MERKLLGLDLIEVKFDAAGDGTFEGYASVFGGVDSYGDTILPGAYKKTLKRKKGDRPIRMRWNHWGPVIGKWLDIAEDEKGLKVTGELTPGHSVAADVYASLKHGAIDGMSIGYRPVQIRELGDGKRELKEIELVEISVVEEPADLAARVGDIKSVVDGMTSLKDIEAWLREAHRFDRDDAGALVHRIKALARREGVDERNTSNQTVLASLALHTHALKMRK
jgi:HK97 family phage prohead protease